MIDREYILRLRLPPGENDPKAGIRKLRAVLKRLLRTYGIKAVSCEPAKEVPRRPRSGRPKPTQGNSEDLGE